MLRQRSPTTYRGGTSSSRSSPRPLLTTLCTFTRRTLRRHRVEHCPNGTLFPSFRCSMLVLSLQSPAEREKTRARRRSRTAVSPRVCREASPSWQEGPERSPQRRTKNREAEWRPNFHQCEEKKSTSYMNCRKSIRRHGEEHAEPARALGV